jgi:glutathione S-transferase
MLTLYHAPRSRSSRIIWLLEEIGAPYEIAKMDIPRRDGSGASDPRNPHPDKKVPALVHDGVLVTESAAICLYLADAFPEARVGPRIGEPLRASFLTWLAYYAGVIEPVVTAKASGATEKDPAQAAAYAAVAERLRLAFERGPFVLGDVFSAADVLVTSVFQWARELMPAGPVFDAYVTRMSERPALQRAFRKDDA